MAAGMTAVNPGVLRWARERSGLSVQEAAAMLGKTADVISEWESGDSAPSYAQLEKVAYKLYKRPLAIFFFPEPPIEKDPKTEFRLLPLSELEGLHRDTLLAVRQGLAYQDSLRELTGGTNPAGMRIFQEINPKRFKSTEALSTRARELLGVSLETQKSWDSIRDAFKIWRDAVESCGIFVFKRSFKQRDVSGFCLFDTEFPIIFINNGTSYSRQIFSLFHELAHILYSISGMTKEDNSYVDELPRTDKHLEVACNKFAASLLVPDSEFTSRTKGKVASDDEIQNLAAEYKVSREVILRKFLDLGFVDQRQYEQKARQWRQEFESRGRTGGGNYYATQATYLGRKFLGLAFSCYYSGRCTLQDLAHHLNVRARNIEGLEEFVTRGN